MMRTALYHRHQALGARLVDFAGWEMPVQYPTGILQEHLLTRKQAGLFDISHMGRFILRGSDVLPFIQHVLSNNAAGLEPGLAQYTMIPNSRGGAVDDAYLYRFTEEEYLLVVNASNREKDRQHLLEHCGSFPDMELTDRTEELVMLALQGPRSREILLDLLDEKMLPEPMRNSLSIGAIEGREVWIARTGYTGEALGFELFAERENADALWQLLVDRGASPVGLGARDSLRLEACLPLYGHELGLDPTGAEIPIFSCPLARFAVSFSPLKGDFVGRKALLSQFETYQRILRQDFSELSALPRMLRAVRILGKGIARAGSRVLRDGEELGWVTSGTVIPYWQVAGDGLSSRLSEETDRRPLCLALLDSRLAAEHEMVEVEIRGKRIEAVTVACSLRAEAPPATRPFLFDEEMARRQKIEEAQARDRAGTGADTSIKAGVETGVETDAESRALNLLRRSIENTRWRQEECINLIPSEQTQSPLVRLLSVMDPAFRYGEHKAVRAFYDADVFYYQGTEFMGEVERQVEAELRRFLRCRQIEARNVSGQMANATVFSALVDYVNRVDRKREPRRMRSVMNNHIIKGGHLSAQPMGALRDFVSRDPLTEKPAVVNFPVLPDNPYRIDTEAVGPLLEQHRPELIILGKSMIIHREPVAEIRHLVQELDLDTVIMYDMAHVLGLTGPHFQEPFAEGADLITGSTHKTFFGTQRGIIASDMEQEDPDFPFWETIRRRTFPGAVSNHHLGTLLGLLLAAYEMNAFKDQYQPQVIKNAKALALALKECGLDVAGDPAFSFTETHQVLVKVGYAQGVEAAQELERNNIIVNFQAAPEEEGFTAAGSLRLGVAEMTRFGMKEDDFGPVAQFIQDVLDGKTVREEVAAFRRGFSELKYCFSGDEFDTPLKLLHRLIR